MPLTFLFLVTLAFADKPRPAADDSELVKLRARVAQLETELDREKREHAYDANWCAGALQISRQMYMQQQQKREK